jgi:hypothetical protein
MGAATTEKKIVERCLRLSKMMKRYSALMRRKTDSKEDVFTLEIDIEFFSLRCSLDLVVLVSKVKKFSSPKALASSNHGRKRF